MAKGKTIGIDATTLDANAALRSIVPRDTGESYEEFLTKLANAPTHCSPDDKLRIRDVSQEKRIDAAAVTPPTPRPAAVTGLRFVRTNGTKTARSPVQSQALAKNSKKLAVSVSIPKNQTFGCSRSAASHTITARN